MDFNTLMVDILKYFGNIFGGNFGIAIILLTIIVRAILWPLGVSQQRSMKVMQTLQPKLKMIQERYKNDPQTMQRKMMEFYKENKFNPMAGCLPMLIQLPIFIILYSALMSPQFIQIAGDSKFLFIQRLDSTIKGSAGISNDGQFNVSGRDFFMAGKNAKVYLKQDNEQEAKVLENVKIQSPKNALKVQGAYTPSEPIDLKIGIDEFDLKFSQLKNIEKAEVIVTNQNTRETETITFVMPEGSQHSDILIASVPTVQNKNSLHLDVVALVLIFGLSMFVTQKVMMATAKNQQQDAMQQAMQKSLGTMMPIMLMATFIFIPIPAGVLLYLVVSNFIQIIQTVVINKQLENEDQKAKVEVINE